jgi:hypothetical protein
LLSDNAIEVKIESHHIFWEGDVGEDALDHDELVAMRPMPEECLPRHVARLSWLGVLLAAAIVANAYYLFSVWAEPPLAAELPGESREEVESVEAAPPDAGQEPEADRGADVPSTKSAYLRDYQPSPELATDSHVTTAPGHQLSGHGVAEGVANRGLPAPWLAVIEMVVDATADVFSSLKPFVELPVATPHVTGEPDVIQPLRPADPPLNIHNPAETAATLSFLVNGELCTLGPGEHQEFRGGASWQIDFHRGGNFPDAHRVVDQGRYRFSATSHGWELIKEAP